MLFIVSPKQRLFCAAVFFLFFFVVVVVALNPPTVTSAGTKHKANVPKNGSVFLLASTQCHN